MKKDELIGLLILGFQYFFIVGIVWVEVGRKEAIFMGAILASVVVATYYLMSRKA